MVFFNGVKNSRFYKDFPQSRPSTQEILVFAGRKNFKILKIIYYVS